jgi:hypothetical protein
LNSGLHLRHSYGAGVVKYLPLQVRQIYNIEIDKTDSANTRKGKIECYRAT